MAGKLASLREKLAEQNLDGFIIPKTDQHLGEFIPPSSERLQWLTGFTGSMGLGIALQSTAGIFVDGRYTLQAEKQVDKTLFTPLSFDFKTLEAWLGQETQKGQKIGFDPWLYAHSFHERLESACRKAGVSLVPLDTNPIDGLWSDRPSFPTTPATVHPLTYAGQDLKEKISIVVKNLDEYGVDATVLTSPESINWLLNFRGDDVSVTPLSLSFAIVNATGDVTLFIEERKLTDDLKAQFEEVVTLQPYEALTQTLGDLASQGKSFLLDPHATPTRIFQALEEKSATILRKDDPCILPRACKNQTEIKGARAAHIRDGAAVSSFLAWLLKEAETQDITEIQAAEKLLTFRERQENFKKPSFDTISSTGPNGAIVHYNPYTGENRTLQKGDLYLVDSGGQYLDGTTDITRVVALGTPTDEQKNRFTRVLKGHISLACVRFPEGTTGSQLDPLARAPLWDAGLDYAHGTGHGVGSYLGVHEGPQRISNVHNNVPLRPGMICSNEPGYYKTGEYGIRIENLVVVAPCSECSTKDRSFYQFETLTLAPIDLNLVEASFLDPHEVVWLNAYHQRVRETLTPLVDSETALWLENATRAI